ncbi:DMP19 family protein [[Clostridium] leptum]|nr:DMP19 family protein [[Clostridium] leptum]CZT56540.1 hypothetical protein BN3661_01428 [Eubacteriaceae bacterium CHKCI005]
MAGKRGLSGWIIAAAAVSSAAAVCLFMGQKEKKRQRRRQESIMRPEDQYHRMTEELFDSTPHAQLYEAATANIRARLERADDKQRAIAQLTEQQGTIYVISVVEKEIATGGLRAFYSHESSIYSNTAPVCFETVGLTQYAQILRQANSLYENGPVGDELYHQFSKLNRQLDDLRASLSIAEWCGDYIRANREAFLDSDRQLHNVTFLQDSYASPQEEPVKQSM